MSSAMHIFNNLLYSPYHLEVLYKTTTNGHLALRGIGPPDIVMWRQRVDMDTRLLLADKYLTMCQSDNGKVIVWSHQGQLKYLIVLIPR